MQNSADAAALSFLKDLIAAQTKGEAAIQNEISARLRAVGCTVETLDYEPTQVPVIGELQATSGATGERRAVIATLPGDADKPSILMFAHPDGEPVQEPHGWRHDPFAGIEDGGRVYGWGVADDLAGCAAAVLALEKLAAAKVPMGRAVFASTPSKRYARGVAAALHQGLRADAALYLHPAESGAGMNEIKTVASGQVEFTICVTGKGPNTTEPGHTVFSHQSVNPIDKALILRAALMKLSEDRATRIRHPLIEAEVGRATNLHISRIRCGEMRGFSRIAELCEIGGALSFPPGETLRQVMDEIEAAVNNAAEGDPWLADHPPKITWMTGVTGAEVSAQSPLYRTAAAAVQRVTGKAPHVNPLHTSSDIRNPTVEAGIPCVGLGCLGGDLSQNDKRDEWVDTADFLDMVNVTAEVVTNWCSGAKPQ